MNHCLGNSEVRDSCMGCRLLLCGFFLLWSCTFGMCDSSVLIGMLWCFRGLYSMWWTCCGWRFRLHCHGSGLPHLLFHMSALCHPASRKTFLCTRREAILRGRLSG